MAMSNPYKAGRNPAAAPIPTGSELPAPAMHSPFGGTPPINPPPVNTAVVDIPRVLPPIVNTPIVNTPIVNTPRVPPPVVHAPVVPPAPVHAPVTPPSRVPPSRDGTPKAQVSVDPYQNIMDMYGGSKHKRPEGSRVSPLSALTTGKLISGVEGGVIPGFGYTPNPASIFSVIGGLFGPNDNPNDKNEIYQEERWNWFAEHQPDGVTHRGVTIRPGAARSKSGKGNTWDIIGQDGRVSKVYSDKENIVHVDTGGGYKDLDFSTSKQFIEDFNSTMSYTPFWFRAGLDRTHGHGSANVAF